MAVRNGGRGTAEVTTLHANMHNWRRRVFHIPEESAVIG